MFKFVFNCCISIVHSETSLTPRDPRWLGAWWLGFLAFGALALISGIPLIFFPKKMRRQKEIGEIEKKDRQQRQGKRRLLHDAKGNDFQLRTDTCMGGK